MSLDQDSPLRLDGVSASPARMVGHTSSNYCVNAMNDPTFPCESNAEELVSIARRFCDLIDGSDGGRNGWLRDVASMLPRLQAAMTSVDPPASRGEHLFPVDLDARFELFSHLRELLAERDAYWLEFDCAQEGEDAMSGSLADDLTDIYCELKYGLRMFDADPERALDAWCLGYDCHWARHLVDAERHLSCLVAQGQID